MALNEAPPFLDLRDCSVETARRDASFCEQASTGRFKFDKMNATSA